MNYQEKKRTDVIHIRVSPEEKAKINHLASSLGMSVSDFMRDRALKGKSANRHANRKAAAGIVRVSNAVYEIYDSLAQTEQETFTRSELHSYLNPIKTEVDSIWY